MEIITVTNLKKYFPITKGLFRKEIGFVRAVDNVSFSLKKGETLGIVGESGSGKTTLARLILKLIDPTSGDITFGGKDISGFNKEKLMNFRRNVQIVFQDPHSSLNPRLTISSTLGEGLIIHKLVKNRKERINRIRDLLNIVGLNPNNMHRYPHEFSGGQRQRIGIARALCVSPSIIILDEPVSSLDVSIQAQILNLLTDLQEKYNLTYIFIAHDLRVIEHISTRIIVMYMGRIVEMAERDDLYKNPLHPYTKLLLDSIPSLNPEERGFPDLSKAESIPQAETNISPHQFSKPCYLYEHDKEPLENWCGDICRFKPRCSEIMPECSEKEPELLEVQPGHFISCFRK